MKDLPIHNAEAVTATEPAPAAAPQPSMIPISIKIAGTMKSGFTFNWHGLPQRELNFTGRPFTHEQARRIAEFVAGVMAEK